MRGQDRDRDHHHDRISRGSGSGRKSNKQRGERHSSRGRGGERGQRHSEQKQQQDPPLPSPGSSGGTNRRRNHYRQILQQDNNNAAGASGTTTNHPSVSSSMGGAGFTTAIPRVGSIDVSEVGRLTQSLLFSRKGSFGGFMPSMMSSFGGGGSTSVAGDDDNDDDEDQNDTSRRSDHRNNRRNRRSSRNSDHEGGGGDRHRRRSSDVVDGSGVGGGSSHHRSSNRRHDRRSSSRHRRRHQQQDDDNLEDVVGLQANNNMMDNNNEVQEVSGMEVGEEQGIEQTLSSSGVITSGGGDHHDDVDDNNHGNDEGEYSPSPLNPRTRQIVEQDDDQHQRHQQLYLQQQQAEEKLQLQLEQQQQQLYQQDLQHAMYQQEPQQKPTTRSPHQRRSSRTSNFVTLTVATSSNTEDRVVGAGGGREMGIAGGGYEQGVEIMEEGVETELDEAMLAYGRRITSSAEDGLSSVASGRSSVTLNNNSVTGDSHHYDHQQRNLSSRSPESLSSPFHQGSALGIDTLSAKGSTSPRRAAPDEVDYNLGDDGMPSLSSPKRQLVGSSTSPAGPTVDGLDVDMEVDVDPDVVSDETGPSSPSSSPSRRQRRRPPRLPRPQHQQQSSNPSTPKRQKTAYEEALELLADTTSHHTTASSRSSSMHNDESLFILEDLIKANRNKDGTGAEVDDDEEDEDPSMAYFDEDGGDGGIVVASTASPFNQGIMDGTSGDYHQGVITSGDIGGDKGGRAGVGEVDAAMVKDNQNEQHIRRRDADWFMTTQASDLDFASAAIPLEMATDDNYNSNSVAETPTRANTNAASATSVSGIHEEGFGGSVDPDVSLIDPEEAEGRLLALLAGQAATPLKAETQGAAEIPKLPVGAEYSEGTPVGIRRGQPWPPVTGSLEGTGTDTDTSLNRDVGPVDVDTGREWDGDTGREWGGEGRPKTPCNDNHEVATSMEAIHDARNVGDEDYNEGAVSESGKKPRHSTGPTSAVAKSRGSPLSSEKKTAAVTSPKGEKKLDQSNKIRASVGFLGRMGSIFHRDNPSVTDSTGGVGESSIGAAADKSNETASSEAKADASAAPAAMTKLPRYPQFRSPRSPRPRFSSTKDSAPWRKDVESPTLDQLLSNNSEGTLGDSPFKSSQLRPRHHHSPRASLDASNDQQLFGNQQGTVGTESLEAIKERTSFPSLEDDEISVGVKGLVTPSAASILSPNAGGTNPTPASSDPQVHLQKQFTFDPQSSNSSHDVLLGKHNDVWNGGEVDSFTDSTLDVGQLRETVPSGTEFPQRDTQLQQSESNSSFDVLMASHDDIWSKGGGSQSIDGERSCNSMAFSEDSPKKSYESLSPARFGKGEFDSSMRMQMPTIPDADDVEDGEIAPGSKDEISSRRDDQDPRAMIREKPPALSVETFSPTTVEPIASVDATSASPATLTLSTDRETNISSLKTDQPATGVVLDARATSLGPMSSRTEGIGQKLHPSGSSTRSNVEPISSSDTDANFFSASPSADAAEQSESEREAFVESYEEHSEALLHPEETTIAHDDIITGSLGLQDLREGEPRRAELPKKELYSNPRKFVELLSKKLVAHDRPRSPGGSANKPDSRWVKRESETLFDPENSVFALYNDTGRTPTLSPPGSPPEPMYPTVDQEMSSFDGSEGSESEHVSAIGQPEAAAWDMITGAVEIPVLHEDEGHPDYVVMPEQDDGSSYANQNPISDDWGRRSPSSSTSELGQSARMSARQRKTESPLSPGLRYGLGSTRGTSFNSKGSGRKGARRRLSKAKFQSINIRKLELPVVVSSSQDGEPDSSSLGGGSLPVDALCPKETNAATLQRKIKSAPDLISLERVKVVSHPVSPVNKYPVPSTLDFIGKHLGVISPNKMLQSGASTESHRDLDLPPLFGESRTMFSGTPSERRGTENFQQYEDDVRFPEREEALLEEELLAFWSVENVHFLFNYGWNTSSTNYLASVRWRQIVGCLKHHEMTKALGMRTPSLHFSSEEKSALNLDAHSHSDDGYQEFQKLLLTNVRFPGYEILTDSRNLNGSISLGDTAFPALSRFLSELSSDGVGSGREVLKQQLPSKADIGVDDLISEAKSLVERFTLVVRDVVAFAALNEIEITESDSDVIEFSVDVKDRQAIRKKARRKYAGDTLQVKDVLRAEIRFPSEGSLVCGLIRLNEIIDASSDPPSVAGDGFKVEMMRMKNLFLSESSTGCFLSSTLPTGYRHILLTVRLNGGLLAEIQFQLKPLFDILGKSGYLLHRQIIELDDACRPRGDNVASQDVASEDPFKPFDMREIIGNMLGRYDEPLPTEPLNDFTRNREKNLSQKGGFSPPKSIRVSQNQSMSTLDDQYDTLFETPQSQGSVWRNPMMSGSPLTGAESQDGWRNPMTTPGQLDSGGWKNPMDMNPGDELLLSGSSHEVDATSMSNRDREEALDVIRATNLSSGGVLLAILHHAAETASRNPRDATTFYGLHCVFEYALKDDRCESITTLGGRAAESVESVMQYSRQCLLRCLFLCNQAGSMGILGWTEDGIESPLDEWSERPLRFLRMLACSYASGGRWGDAESVLGELVLRCEQQLPLYHPTSLTALMDFAAAAAMNGETLLAEALISRVVDRLSLYLSEMEAAYMGHLEGSVADCEGAMVVGGSGINPNFRVQPGRDAPLLLNAFVKTFQDLLSRRMVDILGIDHDIVLLHHSLLADSIVVLANCVAATRAALGWNIGTTLNHEGYYWTLGLAHYRRAFMGFSSKRSLDDASVSGAAYGLARCLREIGESEKALDILSLVVAAAERDEPHSNGGVSRVAANNHNQREQNDGDEGTCYLPHAVYVRSCNNNTGPTRQAHRGSQSSSSSKHTSTAMCLWLMAVMTADMDPNEDGRARAFNLLHAASVSLQLELRRLADGGCGDDVAKADCVDLLSKIENEAKQISRPFDVMNDQRAELTHHHHHPNAAGAAATAPSTRQQRSY